MKKLLLLLFLIPNLVMGEDTILICEGDKLIIIGGKQALIREKVGAIIGDGFIKWDERRFVDKEYQAKDKFGNSQNEYVNNDDDTISFGSIRMKDGVEWHSVNASISRLTGEFSYFLISHKPQTNNQFTGFCKKSKRIF